MAIGCEELAVVVAGEALGTCGFIGSVGESGGGQIGDAAVVVDVVVGVGLVAFRGGGQTPVAEFVTGLGVGAEFAFERPGAFPVSPDEGLEVIGVDAVLRFTGAAPGKAAAVSLLLLMVVGLVGIVTDGDTGGMTWVPGAGGGGRRRVTPVGDVGAWEDGEDMMENGKVKQKQDNK